MICLPWTHEWVALSAMSTALYESDSDTRPIERFTDVAQRCLHCSKLRTTRLTGAWTLAELRGDQP